MTLRQGDAAPAFSASADDYAATMAPSLRPVAREVVRRAELGPSERVIDLGTGTGIGAAASLGEGRTVVGVDAAPGMLEVARREVPEAQFVEADFGALPFADAAFDVAIAVHALLFAGDRVAALREWRRVTRPGGRLSLSVPGPNPRTALAMYRPIYDAYGMERGGEYPTVDDLAFWAEVAGWTDLETAADPEMEIRLGDESLFGRWLRVGARGRATGGWPEDRRAALARDMLAITPREPDGTLRIPFGALYLTARAPA